MSDGAGQTLKCGYFRLARFGGTSGYPGTGQELADAVNKGLLARQKNKGSYSKMVAYNYNRNYYSESVFSAVDGPEDGDRDRNAVKNLRSMGQVVYCWDGTG